MILIKIYDRGIMMPNAEFEYIELLKEAPIKLFIAPLNTSSIHWHREYEVIFVLSGGLSVTCERGSYNLYDGDIMLINSQEIHSIKQIEKDNTCLLLQFSPSIITEVYNDTFNFYLNTADLENKPSKSIHISLQKSLAAIGLLLHYKPDGYQFAIKSGLYAFISFLFSSFKYQRNIQEQSLQTYTHFKDLVLIKNYMMRHFKEDVTAEQLAHALGIARTKVYQILKTTGSSSIKAITNYYRIDYAKHLLKGSNASIQYIATESGFTSDSTFFRVFKDVTGMSPSEFRNAPPVNWEGIGTQDYNRTPISDAILLLRHFIFLKADDVFLKNTN